MKTRKVSVWPRMRAESCDEGNTRFITTAWAWLATDLNWWAASSIILNTNKIQERMIISISDIWGMYKYLRFLVKLEPQSYALQPSSAVCFMFLIPINQQREEKHYMGPMLTILSRASLGLFVLRPQTQPADHISIRACCPTVLVNLWRMPDYYWQGWTRSLSGRISSSSSSSSSLLLLLLLLFWE